MYGNPVIVSTYVIVQGSCSIDFSVLGSGQVELGGQALTEMPALVEHEEAEREGKGRRELTAASERSA